MWGRKESTEGRKGDDGERDQGGGEHVGVKGVGRKGDGASLSH